MRIAILNRMALESARFDSWLAAEENELLLFNSEEKWKSNGEDEERQRARYSVIERIPEYDLGGLLELKVTEHHRRKPIDRIVSNSENDVIRAAQLREKLRIPGQTVRSAVAFRDKVVMKSIVRDAGIEVPDFAPVDSPVDLINFIEKKGYPFVVKPRNGAGSLNTFVIRDETDLRSFFSRKLSPTLENLPNLMVESFVEGGMYHIDGFVEDGRLRLAWPSAYLNGCLAFQSGSCLGSYLLDERNPLTLRLLDYLKKIISALPCPASFVFHAEVFHTPDDRLVFCEIACRTGGAKVAETLEHAFGVNIRKAWFQIEAGLSWDQSRFTNTPRVHAGWLLFPPLPKTLVSVPRTCPLTGIEHYNPTSHVGRNFRAAETSVDQVASVIVSGRSEGEVRDRLMAVSDWFSRETVWE